MAERKFTKGEVSYENYVPKHHDRCDDCRHFIEPNACEGVAGRISPHGYCVRFEREKK